MFSTTLKRSVTTLAVMAGLLAVAGPAGAAGIGHDGARAVGLKADSNQVAIAGFMDYIDDALGSGLAYVNEMGVTAAGDDVPPVASVESPHGTYTSLGRENRIESLAAWRGSAAGWGQPPDAMAAFLADQDVPSAVERHPSGTAR